MEPSREWRSELPDSPPQKRSLLVFQNTSVGPRSRSSAKARVMSFGPIMSVSSRAPGTRSAAATMFRK